VKNANKRVTGWEKEIKAQLARLNLSPTREAEVIEEVAQHVEDRYHDLLSAGLTPEKASQEALAEIRESGLLDGLRQIERPDTEEPDVLGAIRKASLTAGLWKDVRYALRMLLKHRTVTFVAVVTMALGIGVNTTIFATLEMLVFRPFAFGNQERLLMIWEQQREAGISRGSVAPGNFIDWRDQNTVFEQLAAFRSSSFDLSDGSQPERFMGNRVTAGFFEALGTKTAIGRTFTDEDIQSGTNQVVVVKHSLWQSRFGADPMIVGRTIKINGEDTTVIGVMPKYFDFPIGGGELWAPLLIGPREQTDRATHTLQVIGLPRSGVTLEKAREGLDVIARRAQQDYPATNRGRGVRVVPLIQDATRGARVGAPFMFISVLLVLLVACANVANLLLVRAVSQQREIAIRLAMGASRFRVMRQLLADSMLIALLGGTLGLLVAVWSINSIRGIPHDFSKFIPGWERMGIDPAALVFTLVVSVGTGLICGLIPALAGTRININEALKVGGRCAVGGAYRSRRMLVVSQVACSVVLLAGAAVMIRSFALLMRANLGINPGNVLTMQVSLAEDRYASEQSRVDLYQTLLSRLAATRGVTNVGAVGTLPFGYTYNSRQCASVGDMVFPENQRPSITWRVATPDYFAAIGTSLRRGRVFTEQDRVGSPAVAVVNEAFEKQFMLHPEAIGKHIKCGESQSFEIIGVVANVVNEDLDDRTEPEIYVPYAQEPLHTVYLVIRATSNPETLTATVRREVGALDQSAPVFNVKLLEQLIDERMSPKRLAVYGLGGAALIGLILAAVGVYALMSHSVTQQTHEIGLRMALGAQASDVLKFVIGAGMRLVFIGCIIGLIGAWALTRSLAGLMFGVSVNDPVMFATVALLLAAVALFACYLPARSAVRVDPAVALRHR
jgi:putative ABC transport system permease protein